MKLIAFAHLTVINAGVNEGSLPNHKLLRSYRRVLNPAEKKQTMLAASQFHDILLFRGNFDLEINSYMGPEINENSSISISILKEFDSKSEVSSSSFTPAFFNEIADFFEIGNLNSVESIKFRTLNQLRTITLRYDHSYPAFRNHVDLPGLASIAFYVTSVDLDPFRLNCFEATSSFPIKLADSTYIIRFVKCGGVWIELIQRL